MRNVEAIVQVSNREGQIFKERLLSDEAREAFRAFAERRPPDFLKERASPATPRLGRRTDE